MENQSYKEIKFPKVDLDKIEGVFLDLDNTLYSYNRCHNHALIKTYEYIKEYTELDYEEFFKAYLKARSRVNTELNGQGASHSRLLYFQKMFENILGKTHIYLSLNTEKVYWNNFFEKMELVEEAKLFLKKCKENKIPVCIVTDLTAKVQMEKILKLGIEEYINFLVSSEEAGVEKPHPYIFKLAAEKLGVDINKILMVGDNFNRDIRGAELLKIKTVHVVV